MLRMYQLLLLKFQRLLLQNQQGHLVEQCLLLLLHQELV